MTQLSDIYRTCRETKLRNSRIKLYNKNDTTVTDINDITVL